MSKIERALRKAEEEKRKRQSIEDVQDTSKRGFADTLGGVVTTHGIQPGSPDLLEYFQKIATKLKSLCDSRGITDVVFASANSGEGKTTNAVNCAMSLCRDFNLSVCLVDCDLRNPNIYDYFTTNGEYTIIEHLKGEAAIDSVIRPTSVPGLSIVSSRRAGMSSLPLLNTERFGRFVRELRTRFDFVIYDSSPIIPVADVVVLSKHVSGIVLVLAAGQTRRKFIEQSLEQIDKDKVIGFIMNFKKYGMPQTYNYSKYYNYGMGKNDHSQKLNLEKDEDSIHGRAYGTKE